ncbi:MAG: hypothetical protein K9L30_15895 [Desulfobacterales bacterium]|nr:hypothetical protein [Desulfobacterales bacterium]
MQEKEYLINDALRENEIYRDDWELNPVANDLYWFVDFFNIAFFKEQKVPTPVLTFERANVGTLGYYRIGINDFGVKNQINVNRLYLDRPLIECLETLVHEMTHSWEHIYLPEKERTNNWYHKKGFREKLYEIGIETDEKGMHQKVGDPFIHLLRQHGVSNPYKSEYVKGFPTGFFLVPPKKKKGKSKLIKYICNCNPARPIRSGRKDIKALCLDCGKLYEMDNSGL